jgi:hypothetical protein
VDIQERQVARNEENLRLAQACALAGPAERHRGEAAPLSADRRPGT